MAEKLRVILEIGPKRRIVAGAMDWPGLDRWGSSEDAALETMASYLPRYADVAERAGMAHEFASATDLEVVERVPGSSSTDFWGIAHVPSQIEREVLSAADLDRRLDLLAACWAHFDYVATRVSAELATGPRGGGRSRDEIIHHVYASERHNWWRMVGIRAEDGVRLTPEEISAYRHEYIDAIRAYNAEGKPARTWPIQFLIRRTAHHALDHAWEMEDKDLSSPSI
ncbi:MAG: hypothetical protein M3P14_12895 [Chloroflexota bacterium]|nr:hypothetical protein [Chloroflexota bacterium]